MSQVTPGLAALMVLAPSTTPTKSPQGNGKTISSLFVPESAKVDYAGLFGYVGSGGTVKNVAVSGTVYGGGYIGGVVGQNDGTVENCASTVTVYPTGTSESCYAGGVAGCSTSTVCNCYATGAVTAETTSGHGDSYAGGVVGYHNSCTVSDCYWKDNDGDTAAYGIGYDSSNTGCTKFTDYCAWKQTSDYPEFDAYYEPLTFTISGTLTDDSTTVESPDEKDPVTVEGLDDVALAQGASATLTVKETTSSAEGTTDIAKEVKGNTTEFLSITLTKDSDNSTISNPTTVLEICIPYDYTNKSNLVVYRYHDSKVDTFDALEERDTDGSYDDGKFFADEANSKLYIYANQFSTYAVGYPFADVDGDTWYTDPVYWAKVNGITQGTGDTEFSPEEGCTRAEIVTFLYRVFG